MDAHELEGGNAIIRLGDVDDPILAKAGASDQRAVRSAGRWKEVSAPARKAGVRRLRGPPNSSGRCVAAGTGEGGVSDEG
jgi:hypothetical protein